MRVATSTNSFLTEILYQNQIHGSSSQKKSVI